MAMPSLLLQKPSKNSKAKDHLQGLKKRLKDCLSDDISEPFYEEETSQKNIMKLNWPKNVNSLSQTFANLVVKGNVKSAIKLLKSNMENENLPWRHHQPSKAKVFRTSCCTRRYCLFFDEPKLIHFWKYYSINDELVQKADPDHLEWILTVGQVYFYQTILGMHQRIIVKS